jgi:hypothetical protein
MNNAAKLVGPKLYAIMAGMLLAGTANTLLTKWQNQSVGVETPDNCYDPNDKPVPGRVPCQTFTHPYVQSVNMFLGELLCLFVYGGKLFYSRR